MFKSKVLSCLKSDLGIGVVAFILTGLMSLNLVQSVFGSNIGALAQSFSQSWSQPENISKSGAASQPRIFLGPGDLQQVFWIDQFDGLVTSIYSGKAWSSAQSAAIPDGPGDMPFLIADKAGWVHAFWQVKNEKAGNTDSLYHSKLLLGEVAWTDPELLAEDASAYSVYAPANGGIDLAYLRRINSDQVPAGVYIRRLASDASEWDLSYNIFSSIYYRLLTPENSVIRITDDSNGNLLIIWDDPIQNQTQIVQSNDNGKSWGSPENFDQLASDIQNQPLERNSPVNLAALPGTVLAIWQAAGINNCVLYQQVWQSSGDTPVKALDTIPSSTPSAIEEPTSLKSTIPASQSTWSTPEQILPGLINCPEADSYWPNPKTNTIYWLWGEGSSSINLSAWDNLNGQWSLPVTKGFTVTDPNSGRTIVIGDLHAVISNEQIAVAGSSLNNEIWVTRAEIPISDLAYAPPSIWSDPLMVAIPADSSAGALDLNLVMDRSSRMHLAFTQNRTGELGASLLYSYWDKKSDLLNNNTAVLFPGNTNEIARQPALAVDENNRLLHLVWSGGEQGDILYSRAPLDKANITSEWFPRQTISAQLFSSWPQIGIDATDRLYILYSVPINEERGLYLTVSEDHGQTWSGANKIFDAVAAGLQGIDHPTMLVLPYGTLHIAWVENSPTGSNTSQGIFYAFSGDQGKNWSEPVILAGPGNDWPRLAAADGELLLFFAQTQPSSNPADRHGFIWQRTRQLTLPNGQGSPANNENEWSPAMRIPGWDEVNLPYGLAVAGTPADGQIYLVGASSVNGSIEFTSLNNGIWSENETKAPIAAGSSARGLAAATRPEGGTLGISWLSQVQLPDNSINFNKPGNSIYFMTRKIDEAQILLEPTPLPTSTPTAEYIPTPTPYHPTPTPDLNNIPSPNDSPQLPLIIGIILPALVVGIFFTWRLLAKRR